MRSLIHTSIFHAYIRGDPGIVRALQSRKPSSLHISAITAMELRFATTTIGAQALHSGLLTLLGSVIVLPFDDKVAVATGTFSAQIKARGLEVAWTDVLICGHAVATNRTLITIEPQRVLIPGLRVLDWSLETTGPEFT